VEAELWPDGPVCPHCGVTDQATLMHGKSHHPGLYQCNACREPFTVTVGTLYERSKMPLNKWLAATHLMMASKKSMSALEIGRLLSLSKRTAWFLCHRTRESLCETKPITPLGGQNKVVEADETYFGGKEANKHKSKRQSGMQGGKGKEAVVALVERERRVRSHHVPAVTAKTLGPVPYAQIDGKSYLMTDESAVLSADWRDLLRPRHRQPFDRRRRARRLLAREHGQGIFLDLQAWRLRHVPLRQPAALEALPCRVRLPL
jgi:transposase-like protein